MVFHNLKYFQFKFYWHFHVAFRRMLLMAMDPWVATRVGGLDRLMYICTAPTTVSIAPELRYNDQVTPESLFWPAPFNIRLTNYTTLVQIEGREVDQRWVISNRFPTPKRALMILCLLLRWCPSTTRACASYQLVTWCFSWLQEDMSEITPSMPQSMYSWSWL